MHFDRQVASASASIPDSMQRKDTVLTHENFHHYHSETEMMRYASFRK